MNDASMQMDHVGNDNDDNEEEPPPFAEPRFGHQITVAPRNGNTPPAPDEPDEFFQTLNRLRWFVQHNHVPNDLFQLIHNELVPPYNTWLRHLRNQPLETSILKTMENIGFYNARNLQLVVPEPNVAVANQVFDDIDLTKKKLDHVIHRIHEYQVNTRANVNLDQMEEEKAEEVHQLTGIQHEVCTLLTQTTKLAENLYKVLDAATIMSMNFTMLLENANPSQWFKVADLHGCEFEKFLHISKPISMEDSKKFDRHTKLVIFLLDKFRERKFRKKATSDYLYHHVVFKREDGSKIWTQSYSPIKETIEQLVYDMVRKEYRGDLWSTILHSGILKDIIVYIRKCVDDEVPDVKEMPRMWSFEDGIYCAETDEFAYYPDVPEKFPMLRQGYSTYKFMKGHTFAHVYFSQDMTKRPLSEVPMPKFLKIFQDQGWTEQTIYLKLATLGRTFWPAGALDSCQYWPCDWGVGGSGKSTVQDVFKYLFHWQDVGIFGADQEDTFSRDTLPDKRIIIAPEVRGENFGCSLAFFLSIVAGDAVRIPVKYGTPRDVENFPVQGLMATNELPKSYLNDPKGSVARRLLIFPWPRVISPRDPTLKGLIVKEELSAVLRSCTLAYLELPKHVDIMSDYPLSPEMAAARAKLQRASNSLVDFLLSDDLVVLGNHCVVELDALRQAFNDFVKDIRNDRNPPPWNEDLYDYPFRLLRLEVLPEDENTRISVRGCSLRTH